MLRYLYYRTLADRRYLRQLLIDLQEVKACLLKLPGEALTSTRFGRLLVTFYPYSRLMIRRFWSAILGMSPQA